MKLLILLLAALSLSAQTYTRKTICASGCDYVNTASNVNGLQAALNAAAAAQNAAAAAGQCNPKTPANFTGPYLIDIDPSAVLDLAGTTIVLPAKTCAQWVRVRSMRLANLPADGTRITVPADDSTVANMARIQSTGAAYGSYMFNGPTSKTRYWAFEGIDFFGNTTTIDTYGVILQLGEVDSFYPASTDPARRMDHVEVKHCWIHGAFGRLNVSTGIGVQANNVVIRDSVINKIANDGESHAIAVGFSDGPVDLLNNQLDASTITTIVGGALVPAGLLPTFVRYIGNLYSRSPEYKHYVSVTTSAPTYPCRPGNVHRTSVPEDWVCNGAGTWINTGSVGTYTTFCCDSFGTLKGPAQKNMWEAKIGRGTRFYGNDISGGWLPSGQGAETFVLNLVSSNVSPSYVALTPWVSPVPSNANPTQYAQPWTTLTDLNFSANRLHDSMAGWSFAFPTNQTTSIVGVCAAGGVSRAPWCMPNSHNNISMYDNLATNMSDERDYDRGTVGSAQSKGFVTSENVGGFNVDFRHNTYLLAATGQSGYMSNLARFETTGTGRGYNNIRDNIMPTGDNAINWPGGGGSCSWQTALGAGATADLRGNTFITTGQYGTRSFLTGAACPANTWPLGTRAAASNAAAVNGSFRAVTPNTASDGRDAGADIDRVNYATAGAVSGAYNAALEYKLRGAMPTATSAIIYYTANSATPCTFELSTNPDSYASPIPPITISQKGRDGAATWTDILQPGTAYFARATCDGLKLEYGVDGKRFMFITRVTAMTPGPPTPPNPAPTVDSVSPTTGSGLTQTFTYKFSSARGFANLSTVQGMFSTVSSSTAQSCAVLYTQAANTVSLADNAGTGIAGTLTLPTSATVNNGQCTISGTGLTVSGSLNQLTLNVPITFSGSFTGLQNNYGRALSVDALDSGWIAVGSWTPSASAPPPAAPTVDSVSPTSGTGLTQTFTYKFSDGRGYSNFTYAKMLLNTTQTTVGGCSVKYIAPSTIALYTDDASGYVSTFTLPSSATISNSQCTVSGTGLTVTGSGNQLTMVVPITFSASFTGSKNQYGYAFNNDSLASGWIAFTGAMWTPATVAPPPASAWSAPVVMSSGEAQMRAEGSTVHYVYATGGNLYYQKSTNEGIPGSWSAPVTVTTNVASMYPTKSFSVDGSNVHIVFDRAGPNGSGFGKGDVWTIRSTNGGSTWQDEQMIYQNTDPPGYYLRPTVTSKGSFVHIATQNNFFIGGQTGSFASTDLLYYRSTNGGATFASPVTIVPSANIPSRPELLVGPGSDVYLGWHADGGPSAPAYPQYGILHSPKMHFTRSTDNGASWIGTSPGYTLMTTADAFSARADISSFGTNSLMYVWEDDRYGPNVSLAVMYRISPDGGQSWGTEQRRAYTAGKKASHPFSFGLGTNIMTAWFDDRTGKDELFVALSANGGNSWDNNGIGDGNLQLTTAPADVLPPLGAVVTPNYWTAIYTSGGQVFIMRRSRN